MSNSELAFVDAVPMPADILRSPLGKFVKFAANESGYNGAPNELIVKWVHPMFLKAKAAVGGAAQYLAIF